MTSSFQPLFDSLSMTMRTVVESWTTDYPTELATMTQFPLGWVDERGAPYQQPTGKRIRPVLMMLVTAACGADWQRALPAAAAVELLHNFSLVHDDIQDDSEIRHGRPTVWKVWGKAHAINTGDALFTLSYAALTGLTEHGVPAQTVLDVLAIYNRTNLELIRGQYLDMSFEKRASVSVDDYLSMIAGKSAALIAGCAEMGALIGGADAARVRAFYEFGLNLGLAFQIRDDILGIWGDPQVTGKSAASDIASRKKSLPVLFGLSADPHLAALYDAPEMTSEAVKAVIASLNACGALDYAQKQENAYYQRAIAALDAAQPEGEAGATLGALAAQLLGRSA